MPRDAAGFNEVDNVVLADVVIGQRHAEYLTDAPNPLAWFSFEKVLIAVPRRLLRGVGNQFEDPLRACRDLAACAHHRGDVGVVGHNAIKDQPRRYGAREAGSWIAGSRGSAAIGVPACRVSGTPPAQYGNSVSSGSSTGPPVRTLADTSTRSSASTAVAASSRALGDLVSMDRPGAT